jgi:NAD(P)-dependent dehydrogenase (short-subunit alcohol dehydrogenase family)
VRRAGRLGQNTNPTVSGPIRSPLGLARVIVGASHRVGVAARELGGRGITVNSVSPGATDTELLRSNNPLEALLTWTPLGRLGQPADVADVVAFLAGPDGRWLTGQNLHASGGMGG